MPRSSKLGLLLCVAGLAVVSLSGLPRAMTSSPSPWNPLAPGEDAITEASSTAALTAMWRSYLAPEEHLLAAPRGKASGRPGSGLRGACAEARRHGRSLHATRITAYALRYGIGRQLSSQIYEAARAERVSTALAFSLVRVESGFDPHARGPGGSIGLTQIHPRTAHGLAPGISAFDLYSPHLNLRLGFRYFRSLVERFDDVALALTAYNRGPAQVAGLLAHGRDPRNGYARKILRNVELSSGATL